MPRRGVIEPSRLLGGPARPRPTGWPEWSHHLVAVPAFDSRIEPLFIGMQAAAAVTARRVLFGAAEHEIDLELTADLGSGRVHLAGQLLADGFGSRGGRLRVSQARDQWLVLLDEGGRFRVDDLAPGAYRLEFAFKDRVIELPVLLV
jgi:hypothetical protein